MDGDGADEADVEEDEGSRMAGRWLGVTNADRRDQVYGHHGIDLWDLILNGSDLLLLLKNFSFKPMYLQYHERFVVY